MSQLIERTLRTPKTQSQLGTWRWSVENVLALLGLGLGALAGFFIATSAWTYALAVTAAIPLLLVFASQPFLGILLWLVVMPFVSVLPASVLMYWAIYRIMVGVILVLAVLYRMMKVRDLPPARLGPPEAAIALLVVIVPVVVLMSPGFSTDKLIMFGDRMFVPFLMYLAVRLLSPREREMRMLQWVALFIIITQSIIGALSWIAPHVLPASWRHLVGARTSGSLMDADLYAAMLIFSAVLLIQAAFQHRKGLLHYLFLAAAGVSAIFVFLSLERAAWLGGLFVIGGLIFVFRGRFLRLLLVGLFIALIFATGLLSAHVELSSDRLSDTGPIYDRLVVMDAMSRMIQEKPIFGWGYDNLDDYVQQYYRRVGEVSIARKMITSHNTYLTVLTELGLLGFFLYLFPFFWWLVMSLRVWPRLPREGLWSRSLLGVFWLAFLFNFIVSNFIDMRYFPIGVALWWLTLGFIANMVYPYLKGREATSPADPGLL